MHTCLSIAGSDSIGGAGIQADIKTMLACGVYAMTAITALTAQNTLGVSAVNETSPEMLTAQLNAVFSDIVPDSVKIGMLPSALSVHVVSKLLKDYNAKNIVIDPVMIATSGASLTNRAAVEEMKKELFPLATLITPNIFEAETLFGSPIQSRCDMEKASKALSKAYSCAVLIKGGHSRNDANDCLYNKNELIWFSGERIENENTHGTGCTLSSATSAYLARGFSLIDAIQNAKGFISGSLKSGLNLGHGNGPLNHGYKIKA